MLCNMYVYLGIDAKESSMFHLFLNDVSAARWMAFFEDLWIFDDCKHVTWSKEMNGYGKSPSTGIIYYCTICLY